MPLFSKSDISKDHLKGRLLGFDLGTKTIGIAVSDPSHQIATPVETLKRKKFSQDLEGIKSLLSSYEVNTIILGLPINMDGSESARSQSTRQFAKNILNNLDINIVLWDERLSTQAVTRTLLDADISRQKRANVVDKLAACYILQGFLDYISRY